MIMPGIYLSFSEPVIPFKLGRRRFAIKTELVVDSHYKGQGNILQYFAIYPNSLPQLADIYPIDNST
jgi:hypothetical protein